MSTIPMQIRSPDIVGQLARSAQAAGIQNNVARENRLMQLYREQGPQIAAGDQGALAALSRHSPQQALGIEQKRQQMRISEEQLRMTREKFRMATEAEARKADAAEAAAAARQIESIVAMAIADPENADAIFASDDDTRQFVGTDPRVAAASLLGIKDALEMAAGPKPQSGIGKVQADIDAGLLLEGTPLRASRQSETIYDSEGNVIVQRGDAPPKMTVDAAKNTGFYIRTIDAHDTLNELEEQGLNFFQQSADAIPLGLGNYARTPEFQRFDQARRDFVNAILRRESGAVIADSEFENANKQYFPQPGDSPEVIAQKRRNRRNAIEGIRAASGAGAQYVEGQKASEPQQMTFEQFATDPSAQAAAAKYGVTLEEMWAIKQANDG